MGDGDDDDGQVVPLPLRARHPPQLAVFVNDWACSNTSLFMATGGRRCTQTRRARSGWGWMDGWLGYSTTAICACFLPSVPVARDSQTARCMLQFIHIRSSFLNQQEDGAGTST